ncbi:cytochrome c oxidase subunit 3 [Psychromonas sp. Urea-02u-13]|uniref:cytochrome c oxidase subunit 3 n=1 Tax=Psychromonas sp. Urea-02u-13 TaxID=2058326 RepID=UPI000C34110D|nr:cytochrome c oxidase subunit 3 [Psychromonas sp. Urea-02u-13]PKG40018.1 cytochrome c oxidase subunit 3 [Psychromonas sp. Urea-02u-13]
MSVENKKLPQSYYVPAQSPWPIVGAIALFFIAVGSGLTIMQLNNSNVSGVFLLVIGLAILFVMLFSWFKDVITESNNGLYSTQMDVSFKQAMLWFIFSEVMFFLVFFGALFYTRNLSVPWLGGASNNVMTQQILWPDFQSFWPLLKTPAGDTTQAMGWQGLPLINTLILITSSVTLHIAENAMKVNNRRKLQTFIGLTVVLGGCFLTLQVQEYIHAYTELGLTLQSGVYGNTFYLLTGFHGLHVTLGLILLVIVYARILRGHFNDQQHFALQAGSWYWHFVDVVWLCLFFLVYVF